MGHQAKAIVDPKLDPTTGSAQAKGWIWSPLADAVCFHKPFTRAEQLEESQSMKDYSKKTINHVKDMNIKRGRHLPFIVSSDRLSI